MSRTIFAIANWKFGALMGGFLTLFTVLYVVGYSLSCVVCVFKAMRRIVLWGVQPTNSETGGQ